MAKEIFNEINLANINEVNLKRMKEKETALREFEEQNRQKIKKIYDMLYLFNTRNY